MRVNTIIAGCLFLLTGFITLAGWLEWQLLAWCWNWIRPAGWIGILAALWLDGVLALVCTVFLIWSTLHLFLLLDALLVMPAKRKQWERNRNR